MAKHKTQLPNERLILQCIYDLYRNDPMGPLPWEDSAGAKIYKPIDSTRVARALNADPGIMFGRLYYHLDRKYRYTQDDGSKVHLFAFVVGNEHHCVNFPLLCGILSEKKVDFTRTVAPMVVSVLSLLVSFTSLAISLFVKQ